MLSKQYESSGSTLRISIKSLAIGVALLCALPVNAQVRIERPSQGIQAELEDKGDYYLRPDGSKVKFYRKKNVFVVRNKAKARAAQGSSSMQRFKAQFGDRVKPVKGHRLGSANVVRIDNSPAMKAKTKQGFDINARMLQNLDSNIASLQPVLTGSRGQGDILIAPKLLVKLHDDVTSSDFDALLDQYKLSVVRRLNVSGQIYSVQLNNNALNPSQIFSITRAVMSDARVQSAQPQFSSKPRKTVFTPSDEFFSEQWHLSNNGHQGSLCDADCDADNAWGISGAANGNASAVGAFAGAGTVIAIIDDGVDLGHEDLTIWRNDGEFGDDGQGGLKQSNGIDDDENGFVDDVNGWDFVDDLTTNSFRVEADFDECQVLALGGVLDATDSNGQACYCSDGDVGPPSGFGFETGQDNNPNPAPNNSCIVDDSLLEAVTQDNHGTAVAGLAAANSGNATGVVGAAFNAEILPIRLVSPDFDGDVLDDFCARAMEAMTYAGRYADVVNNSYSLEEGTCPMLESVIDDVVDGTLFVDPDGMGPDPAVNLSKRQEPTSGNGSPVIFASGNNASGWTKVTVPVLAGEHAYEWRYLREDSIPFASGIEEIARIDDITLPGSIAAIGFENVTDLDQFTNDWTLNSCTENCMLFQGETEDDFSQPMWTAVDDEPSFAFSGSNFIELNYAAEAGDPVVQPICGYAYLHLIHDAPQDGEISFWVWVSTDTSFPDGFEFLVDGQEQISYGDFPAFGFVDNAVAFPANLASTIAVGASDSGDLSGVSTPNPDLEKRAPYSQFGTTLDVVASSSNQHLAIVTTDRTGPDGFNVDGDIAGNESTNDSNYTDDFRGTSASAPIVAGIAAAIIAIDIDLSAAEVRTIIQDSADQIGGVTYAIDGDRNVFYGHGRVNMFKALSMANGTSNPSSPAPACLTPAETLTYTPATDLIVPVRYTPDPELFCAAEGPLVEPDDQLCVPIRATNGNIALICL